MAQIILLNLLWFASVLGAANALLLPAILSLFLLLAVVFVYQGFDRKDCKVILISLLCGLLIDGFLNSTGWLVYAAQMHDLRYLPPFWIMMLWLGFAATIRTGMNWMLKSPALGAVFMLIGAPLSYYSASRLGAVELLQPWPVMITIGLTWLVYFLILTQIHNQPEGRDVLV
ncbi:DUF2878 domain-containing protein [Marinicella sediminis]|uniref:DUF2878 domain-containing protein n=1 Tax=Marinicella sediminis TaxID=1792834 RepID=UPI0018E3A681|nr:DUF2878 domain-containing protein [Marinicella sediminis]